MTLAEIAAANRAGQPVGIPSWCTAHPETLRTVANALELPLTELAAGGPIAVSPVASPGSAQAQAEGLRVVLAGVHSLGAMLGDQDAPSFGWLRARTDRACTLARGGRFHQRDGDDQCDRRRRRKRPHFLRKVVSKIAFCWSAVSGAVMNLNDTASSMLFSKLAIG